MFREKCADANVDVQNSWRMCCGLVLIFARHEIVLNAVVIVMHDTKSFCYSNMCISSSFCALSFCLIGSTDIPISLS